MRYSVRSEWVAGVEIAVLRDQVGEAEVRVAPSLGNTCIGFRVGDWHVLDEPQNEEELLRRASSYGIPILFPWPNRLRDGRFTWEGREYRLPPSPGMRHANHGLVRDRPWRVKRTEALDDGALVESEILSTDFPELAEQYPSAFRLSVSHRLRACRLVIDVAVENIGGESLPFGFGLHPYFAVPLYPGGKRADCEVWVPADEFWELVDHLPTGRRRAVGGQRDLRHFRRLGEATYDDVFVARADSATTSTTDSAFDLPHQAALKDGRREVVIGADSKFRAFVVFAPAHRSVVSLEPYTCATDALNLQAREVESGPRVLEAGARWQARVVVEALD